VAASKKDFYQTLAVPYDATAAQIKAAFRKKAMRYHPDHNPGKEAWANKKLQGIIEAYEVLSDPAKRRLYNRWLVQQQEVVVRREARRRPEAKSKRDQAVDIMVHPLTPGWARTAAFGYVIFDYLFNDPK
jgi:DnaJ-class molecular chaperone